MTSFPLAECESRSDWPTASLRGWEPLSGCGKIRESRSLDQPFRMSSALPTSSTPDKDAPRGAAEADVGLVAALSMELGPFVNRCLPVQAYVGEKYRFQGLLLHDIRIATVESGTGAAHATRATQALIDGHKPKWVVSIGFSGALQPHLKVGDLVIADSIVDANGKGIKLDTRMKSSPKDGLYVGKFINLPQVVRTVAEKKALGEQTEGLAVDQESLAIGRVCAERQIRFMSVRVISDTMEKDLPPEALAVFGKSGFLRAGVMLNALWRRPSSWSELWNLREQSTLAAARLGLYLKNVVEKLGEESR